MSTLHTRSICCGQGIHSITVDDGGVIVESSIGPAPGFNHWSVYGLGFRKVRETPRDAYEREYAEKMERQFREEVELEAAMELAAINSGRY